MLTRPGRIAALVLATGCLAGFAPNARGQQYGDVARIFEPTAHVDAVEGTAGPLDMAQVTLGQHGTQMLLRIITASPWSIADLQDALRRSVCVQFFFGTRATAQSRICVQGTDEAPALTHTRFTEDGQPEVIAHLDAVVTRPDPQSIEATFTATAAELPLGPFRWFAHTEWLDEASCAAVCSDRFPTGGSVLGRSRPLARPRCFGASARNPNGRCVNALLSRIAFPPPADALLLAGEFCYGTRETDLLHVCRFRGAPRSVTTTTVALIGDSHAGHWRAAVNVVATAKRWRGISLTRTRCPFSGAKPHLPAPQRRSCVLFKQRVVRYLKAHPEIRTLFMSNHPGAIVVPRGQGNFEAKVAGARRALGWLPRSIQRVFVIRDTPQILPSTSPCVEHILRRRRRTAGACPVPRRKALTRDPFAVAVRRMNSRRVTLIDMTRFFCGARLCFPVIGGALVHKDLAHLTATYSETLGPFLLRRVDAMAGSSRVAGSVGDQPRLPHGG